jgi:diaminopimelate decarboxylase
VKARIFDDALLRELAERHGTPLYVYDAATMLARADELNTLRVGERRFDVVRYAQKANSNLALLRLLRERGVLVDAVSAGEISRALAAGYEPREIQFCADVFDDASLALLAQHACEVNLGSADMLEPFARIARGRGVTLRVNPGAGHGHDTRVTTGGELSKHGIWHADLPAVARRARELGLAVVGLHVHIGSGSDLEHLARTSDAMLRCAQHFTGTLAMLSCGGGLPIPYREGEPRIDLRGLLRAWNAARESLEAACARPVRLEIEPGRYLVAEAGCLLARVLGRKRNGELDYILLDAGFNDLLRPALYGAYHEISIVGRDGEPRGPRVVAGPLCESGDVFTQSRGGIVEPRLLPDARAGDLACIHDAGAYGASMASNYNSQLLAAEILVHNGRPRVVRVRQTLADLLRNDLP